MSLTNPNTPVSQQDLQDFYHKILPYMGGSFAMIANKFSKGDLYSTEEKMIGQWTNGKPLYARTYETTVTSSEKGTWKSIGSVPSDISIKKYNPLLKANDGSFQMKDDGYVGTNYLTQEMYQSAIVKIVNNVLKVYVNTAPESVNLFPFTYNITLYYTKTTDSAVSIGNDTDYSTEEKIIGTWIDGKPVYQKTVEISSVTRKSWNTTAHGISNIDKVVKYEGFLLKSNGSIQSLGADDDEKIMGFANRTNVELWLDLDLSSAQGAIVTIQYTKTTD